MKVNEAFRESTAGPKRLVLFDGTCRFCNRSIALLYRWDKRRRFYFATLSSSTAHSILHDAAPLDSIVYVERGQVYYKSAALIQIVRNLPYPYKLLLCLQVIPRRWRDTLYDWIARNRIRWFGFVDQCFLPKAEDRHRFL